jgi:hypothetical protein
MAVIRVNLPVKKANDINGILDAAQLVTVGCVGDAARPLTTAYGLGRVNHYQGSGIGPF